MNQVNNTVQVRMEVCVVEAEERAPAVVEAARRHGASLLVLGQRRRARWSLGLWPAAKRQCGRMRRRISMVEHCIAHAPCEALGVRRRSSGGYFVSSKHHKDFWLLA
jgi:K+-sensing histidine kinase KdpD